MPRPNAQAVALSGGNAVLGLLIERPANSYQLERRLESRFGSADFAHGTAYHAVRRLVGQGLIRPVAAERDAPAKRRDNRHRVRGDAARRRALPALAARLHLDPAGARGAAREDLLLPGPQDLPRMIEIVRDAELACTAQLQQRSTSGCAASAAPRAATPGGG